VIFHSLGKAEIERIVEIRSRTSGSAWPSAATTRHSARVPLKRMSQRRIENPLAVEVLAGRFAEGDTIVVEPDGETLRFRKEVPAAGAS
jgi:ATP-dependent Clp protease ATP-binding subunit ClpA